MVYAHVYLQLVLHEVLHVCVLPACSCSHAARYASVRVHLVVMLKRVSVHAGHA